MDVRAGVAILRHYGPTALVRALTRPAPVNREDCPPDPTRDDPADSIVVNDVRFNVRPYSSDHRIIEETRDAYISKLDGIYFDSVVDMGAHVGGFALQVAKHNPLARVVAIEPHPDNYALLCRNVRDNSLGIETINAAISDQSGFARLAPSTTENSGGHHLTCTSWRTSIPVRTIDAMEIVKRGHRVLVKIDVEGWEVPVFRRLRRSRNIVAIVGELHTTRFAVPADAVAILKRMGFSVSTFGHASIPTFIARR
jgi:FkbM family methyltransferase